MNARWGLLLLVTVGLAGLAICVVGAKQGDKKVDTRVFELRTYHVHPGKLPALHARFRDHTNKLLEKHGMTLLGFWTPNDPKTADITLYYLVAHPSQDAAEKNWAAFGDDPVWKTAKAASEKDGPIVAKVERVFLKPTAYSALK